MDQQFRAYHLQGGGTASAATLAAPTTPTAFANQNNLAESHDRRRGSQSPPVITTLMSPTLKKTLDTKVDTNSLETFKKQIISEINTLLSKTGAGRALDRSRSPRARSRNGSLSRSHAVLNRS